MADQAVTLRITADATGLVTGVGLAKRETKGLGEEGERAGQKMSSGMSAARKSVQSIGEQFVSARKQVLGFAAAYAGFNQISSLVRGVISNTIALESATSQMSAAIRSTGGAMGYTRSELMQMAQAMQQTSTFGATAIKEAQTRMLSYSGVVGENMPRAMQSVLDQSARLGMGLNESAELIGKALESPLKAAEALSRQGFGAAFTDEVKQVISGLVDAGKEAEAQVMILEILEESYGGAAKAARETLGGGLTALREALADLLTVENGLPAVRSAVEDVIKALQAPETKAAINALLGGIIQMIPPLVSGLRTAVEWVARFANEIGATARLAAHLAPVLLAMYGAQLLSRAAQFTLGLIAQAKQYAINIALARELGIAQQQGFMASVKSIGIVNGALGVLVSTYAGWQIGTWLREEFLEVERFGIAMVGGLLKAWERLKAFGIAAWEGIKAAALGAVNVIRGAAATLVGALARANEATDLLGIKSGITAKLREMEQQLRPTTSAWDGFKKGLSGVLKTLGSNEQAIDDAMMELWDFAKAQREAAAATDDHTTSLDAGTGALVSITGALDSAAESTVDLYTHTLKLTDATDAVDSMLRDLAYGLASDATKALMDYEDVQARILELEMQWLDLGPMSETQIAKLAELRRLAVAGYERQLNDLGGTNEREAHRMARDWERFSGSLADAILAGSKGVKRWWKAMLDDMKRQLLQSGILRLMHGLFGGAAVPGLAMASSGMGVGFGSILQMAGGLGGGTGGSLLSGLAGAISGGISTGLMSLGAGLAGLGMGGLGGGLAWAGGSIASSGLIGGLGGSFMTGLGNLFGAGGGAMMGIGQMIPMIAAIAGVAAAIQKLSGGKLFGSSYKFDSASRDFDFSAAGAAGSESLTEVRQRSLFRGRKWRTTDSALDAETANSIEEFWNAILDANTSIARQFGRDAAVDVAASFKQSFDADGNVTSEIGTILGRTYAESWEQFGQRISAENIIANIDAALGTTISAQIGDAIAGPVIGGIDDALERIGRSFNQLDGGGVGGQGTAGTSGTRGEASAIAERWRHDAELLAEGAQFLLLAATDIQRGTGLLADEGGLTAITNLIEDLQRGSETLSDTYTRVATSAALLDQALALSGVQIDGTREHIVRLATAIAEAAGGLDQATALWQSFFNNFYNPAELAQFQQAQLQQAATTAFAGAGLDIAAYLDLGGMERFRAEFEAAMPTMSAEDIAAWLRAADALAAVTASARAIDAAIAENAWQLHLDGLTDAERAIAETTKYYDDWIASATVAGVTAEQLAAIEEQRAVAMGRLLAAQAEAQAQAEADYQRAVRDIRDELDGADMSTFALAMRDIERWTTSTTASLNTAAIAAGRQGAAEADLALVHQVAAQRAAAAIAQLRSAAASLVTELFGPAAGSLDDINARIANIEASSNSSFEGVSNGIESAVNTWLNGIARVQDFLDSILLDGSLTTLTPEQQLAEAQRQYDTLLTAAQGGDAEALSALPDAARSLLDIARGFWSSGDQYQAIFDSTRAGLQSVAGMAGPVGTGGESLHYGGGGSSAVSGELAALYAERDALLAEQEAAQRAEMIESLGGMIRELIAATGDPLAEVAASIGLNLSELAGSLGINLNEMSAATATSLVDMARMLGVDVAELASNVGVSLGGLADRQSLLNQALDATLTGVPEDIRAQLLAPLDAIRSAATEADAKAAIGALDGTLDGLPADIRNLLAPYFEGIDPTPVVSELTRLSDLSVTASLQLSAAYETNDYLRRIAENMSASNSAAGIPAYAAGGWVNGPTTLLAGEAGRELILPNPVSEFFQRVGIPINTGGGGTADAGLVRELIAEVRQLRAERLRGDREVAAAAAGAGDKVADKIERQTDADDRRAREQAVLQSRGVY